MGLIDEVSVKNGVRERVTTELSEIDHELSTRRFFEQNFPDVLEKGRDAATKMAEILEGRVVRRSYFMPTLDAIDRAPVYLHVTRVTVEEAGIVRVYDVQGKVREFPALVFTFVYREDGKAVICMSSEYTVLFEQVA